MLRAVILDAGNAPAYKQLPNELFNSPKPSQLNKAFEVF